jgi:hypothetical protein
MLSGEEFAIVFVSVTKALNTQWDDLWKSESVFGTIHYPSGK